MLLESVALWMWGGTMDIGKLAGRSEVAVLGPHGTGNGQERIDVATWHFQSLTLRPQASIQQDHKCRLILAE